jgi:deoxyribodipyrimidine photo-lyase
MNSIFIFHRDLRKDDNIGLIETIKMSEKVYPVFIFTPDQVSSKNEYKSDHSVQFMVNSLKELSDNLPISFFYDDTTKTIKDLLQNKTLKINNVAFNKDFTLYAKKRDGDIKKMISSHFPEVTVNEYDDVTLQPMDKYVKKDGEAYKVYTPFYNFASKMKVNTPVSFNMSYKKKCHRIPEFTLEKVNPSKFYNHQSNTVVSGGRKEGINILSKIVGWKDYNMIRNNPSMPTTRLSAHLKFGTVSPREAYHIMLSKLGSKNELIKQLYWRDFYMTVLHHYPDYYKSFTKPKMNSIKWKSSTSHYNKWKDGQTGVPLVDAGMRELNKTGFMHNRVRMVVATFLIFNLGLNWKLGEKYFSQKLVDADIANNLGNWKWVAGIETYSNDYYKAMNVSTQMERFDPDAKYVKMWCPELADIPPKDLFNWEENYDKYKDVVKGYPKPIVNVKESRLSMLENYKKGMTS